jgi:hypothetical protein
MDDRLASSLTDFAVHILSLGRLLVGSPANKCVVWSRRPAKGFIVNSFLLNPPPAPRSPPPVLVLISSHLVQLFHLSLGDGDRSDCFSEFPLKEPPVCSHLSLPSVSEEGSIMPATLYLLTKSALSIWLLPIPSLDSETQKMAPAFFDALPSPSSLHHSSLLHWIPLRQLNELELSPQTRFIAEPPLTVTNKTLHRMVSVRNQLLLPLCGPHPTHQCVNPISWPETLGEDCSCPAPQYLLQLDLDSPFNASVIHRIEESLSHLQQSAASRERLDIASKLLPLMNLLNNLLAHGRLLLQLMRDQLERLPRLADGIAERHAAVARLLQRLVEVRVEASLWSLQISDFSLPPSHSLNSTTEIFRAVVYLHELAVVSSPSPLSVMNKLSSIIESLSLTSRPSTLQRRFLVKLSLLVLIQTLIQKPGNRSASSLSPVPRLFRLLLGDNTRVVCCSPANLLALLVLDLFSRLLHCDSHVRPSSLPPLSDLHRRAGWRSSTGCRHTLSDFSSRRTSPGHSAP